MAERAFGVAAGLDPEVAAPLAGRCAELGYALDLVERPPGGPRPRDPRGVRRGRARARARRRGDGARPPLPRRDRRSRRATRARPRSALDRRRRRLLEEAADDDARARSPSCARRCPGVRLVLAAMGPKMCALAGAEYDGAFFNWMTPGVRRRARENVESGAARGGPRDPAGLRLRPHRRRRRRREPGWPRRSPSTATCTTATATTSTASASPRGRSASQPPTARPPSASSPPTRRSTTVVRGLASAREGPMLALAEAAAPAADGG